MRTEDFDYDLPEKLIAQHPPKVRGSSRLLTLDKKTGVIGHQRYSDLHQFLQAGDVIVLNNTKVIKARLVARNKDGKARELLLLEQHGQDFGIHTHKVLYRGKIHKNEVLTIKGHEIIVKEVSDGGIATVTSPENLLSLSEEFGSVPLPPYMKREATEEDIARYQTVFAEKAGSVAAPTASLNFTDTLEQQLKAKGVKIVYLTLHVGLGTFLPIRVDDVTKHKMHSEYFEVSAETVKAIQTAKKAGNKVLAIGTTVARTLEYAAPQILSGLSGLGGLQGDHEKRTNGTNGTESESRKQSTPQSAKSNSGVTGSPGQQAIAAGEILAGEADIFIYPGYEFKVVNKLVTNFHAPRTTVLMLTAAFAGWDKLEIAYKEAVKERYAFLSYGDSMFIH